MRFDWQKTFDEVKRRGDLGSDAQLANYLGVTRAQISAWRNGKSDLGTLTKLKLLDALGYGDLRSVMLSLWPTGHDEKIILQHFRLVERVRGITRMRNEAMQLLSLGGVPLGANRLLAALPAAELEDLRPYLVDVSFECGQTVYGPDDPTMDVYLPTTAVFSALHVPEDGTSAVVAVVGADGIVGITLVVGGRTFPTRTIAQKAGHAFRLNSDLLSKRLTGEDSAFRTLLFRCARTTIGQMARTAFCNSHHSLLQRLSRWVLLSVDQTEETRLEISLSLLGTLLGEGSKKIDAAVKKLHINGALRYDRESIEILDRAVLEARCCSCYDALRLERPLLSRDEALFSSVDRG